MRLRASRRLRPTPRHDDSRRRRGGRAQRAASRGPTKWGCDSGRVAACGRPLDTTIHADGAEAARSERRAGAPRSGDATPGESPLAADPSTRRFTPTARRPRAASGEQGPHEVGMRLRASRRLRPTPRHDDSRRRRGGRAQRAASRGPGAAAAARASEQVRGRVAQRPTPRHDDSRRRRGDRGGVKST